MDIRGLWGLHCSRGTGKLVHAMAFICTWDCEYTHNYVECSDKCSCMGAEKCQNVAILHSENCVFKLLL